MVAVPRPGRTPPGHEVRLEYRPVRCNFFPIDVESGKYIALARSGGMPKWRVRLIAVYKLPQAVGAYENTSRRNPGWTAPRYSPGAGEGEVVSVNRATDTPQVPTVPSVNLRKSVATLTAGDLASLRAAFVAVMGISDERGYQYFAGIHGLPLPGYCVHHDAAGVLGNLPVGPLFLPWHRAYLYFFEQALQDQVAGVTLPWWDWTTDPAQPALILHVGLRGPENRSNAPPVEPAIWRHHFSDALQIPTAFASFLSSELNLVTSGEPPALVGVKLQAIVDLTELIDISGFQQLPGGSLKRQAIGYFVAGRDESLAWEAASKMVSDVLLYALNVDEHS